MRSLGRFVSLAIIAVLTTASAFAQEDSVPVTLHPSSTTFLSDNAAIVMNNDQQQTIDAIRDAVESAGGHLTIYARPGILIAQIPDEGMDAVSQTQGVRFVTKSPLDPTAFDISDPNALLAVGYFNWVVSGRAEAAMDLPAGENVTIGSPAGDVALPSGAEQATALAAGDHPFLGTSVLVNLVFLNDSQSSWDADSRRNAYDNTVLALTWWNSRVLQQFGVAHPTFVPFFGIEIHDISISQSAADSTQAYHWANAAMSAVCNGSCTWFDSHAEDRKDGETNVRNWNIFTRGNNSDSFAGFLINRDLTVDSGAVAGYAHILGGAWWAIGNSAISNPQVIAHETGHIYWACDEFDDPKLDVHPKCTGCDGPRNALNGNADSVASQASCVIPEHKNVCIMKYPEIKSFYWIPNDLDSEYLKVCPYTRIQINWLADNSCYTDVNWDVPSRGATHWQGTYWSDSHPPRMPPAHWSGGPQFTRDDGGANSLDFDFVANPLTNACITGTASTRSTDFSVRWRRIVNFAAGTYQFHGTADDFVAIYVDNFQLQPSGTTGIFQNIQLTAGQHTVQVDYYQTSGSANVHVDWVQVANPNCGAFSASLKSYQKTDYCPGEPSVPHLQVVVSGNGTFPYHVSIQRNSDVAVTYTVTTPTADIYPQGVLGDSTYTLRSVVDDNGCQGQVASLNSVLVNIDSSTPRIVGRLTVTQPSNSCSVSTSWDPAINCSGGPVSYTLLRGVAVGPNVTWESAPLFACEQRTSFPDTTVQSGKIYVYALTATLGTNCVTGTKRGYNIAGVAVNCAATITTSPVIASYGDQPTLTAHLTVNGTPLANRAVQFDLDGANVGSGMTDANGNANATTTITLAAGTYPAGLRVRFLGDETWYAATATADVIVCAPQTLTTPPDQNVWQGQSTLLSFTLTPETGNTTTWYRGAYPDETNPLSTAVNNPSYVFLANETAQYWAKVVQDNTCVSHTGTVNVTVCVPRITAQPSNAAYDAGTQANLSITATGSGTFPIAYQWYQGSPGDYTHPFAAGASINFTASQTATYFCRVSTSCQAIDSTPATITVCQRPTITATSGTTVAPGTYGSISVTATGTGLTYQWYRGTVGNTNFPINGAVGQGTQDNPSATTNYWCRVTSSSATNCSVDSPPVTITVCALPAITTQPGSPIVSSGGSTILSVVASNATGYQWYRGTAGDYSTPLTGQNGASLNTGPLTQDTNFFVRVYNGPCVTDSATASVRVCILTALITTPSTQIMKSQLVTLTASIANQRGTDITYSWYQGVSPDISHPQQSGPLAYVPVAPAATSSYWVRVSDGTCTVDSAAITLNVCVPRITTNPQTPPNSVAAGANVLLSAASDLTDITWQWYAGASGVTTSPISGANYATYNVNASTTQSYWARATSTSCGAYGNSTAATVTVCTPPSLSVTYPNQYITYNSTASMTVSATGPNLTYQWYSGASGNVTSPVTGTGSNTATLTRTFAQTSQFWCRVWSGGACPADSQTITIDVCTTPSFTAQPGNPTIAYGQSTSMTATATSNTGTVTYQWYKGQPGDYSTPAGSTQQITTGTLTADTTYWVRATRGACYADSNGGTVTVCHMSVSATGANAYYGQNVTLSASVTNPRTGSPYYEWFRGNAGDTSYLLTAGTNLSSIQYSNVTSSFNFWVRVTDQTCTASSGTTAVSMCVPRITSDPQSIVITAGSNTNLTVGTTGVGLTFQWYRGLKGDVSSPITSGGNGQTLNVAPSQTTTYWVLVTGCSSVQSNAATVTICQPPSANTPTTTNPVISGGLTSVSVSATGTGLHYQWYRGQTNDTSAPVFTDAASVSFNATSTNYYWVRVSGSCGNAVNTAAIPVSVYPQFTTQPQDITISSGSTGTLSVVASGTYLSYQWYRGSGTANPVGTNSASFTTPALTVDTMYWVRVTSGTAYGDSSAATVHMCQGPGGWLSSYLYSGNCYNLNISGVSGYDLMDLQYDWYQGQSGDVSHPLGSASYYLMVCPTVQTTYWARVWLPDRSCYTNSNAVTVH